MAAPKGNNFAAGNSGGRPTSYKPEYCDQVIEFFNREPNELVMIKDEDGNETPAVTRTGTPIFKPCPLPTKEGFAIKVGVHRATLINWANENQEFFDAIKRAEDMQKEILVQNGLVGAYDKTFAIFTAKNVTDMHDKQVIEQTSNNIHYDITPNADPKEAAQEYLDIISQE